MNSAPHLVMLTLCGGVLLACAVAWARDLLRWLRSRRPASAHRVPSDDEVQAHMVARAFQSGNMVFAERQPDGSVEMWEEPEFAGGRESEERL